jgi:uncharacterized repeat protein (TIGR03803 family)
MKVVNEGRFPAGLGREVTTVALALAFVLTLAVPGTVHAQNYQVLYNFAGGRDGAQPYAGLSIDRGGKLYGTTHSGNEGVNWGVVFQFRRAGTGWIFAALQLFDGALAARAIIGPDGSLYGTSPNNLDQYRSGYVFNLRPQLNACTTAICNWNATVIYGFSGGADGGQPRYGDVVFDAQGHMYGTTSVGGNGLGVVYKMTQSGGVWSEQPIYAFSGTPDGATPFGGVVFDSMGNMYGATTQGGANGLGAVYELSPNGGGWSERVIYSFTGGTDGGYPTAGLYIDNVGNLFGSTSNGGSGGGGTVFELSPSGSSFNYTLLNSFTGGTQCGPWGTLSADSNGNLFGTTVCDGATGHGNVYELARSGGGFTYSSVHDFAAGNDGSRPYGNVTFDASGNMFGTASLGGTHGSGVIWELTP